jgi:DNA polymerase-3 subunit epsilon
MDDAVRASSDPPAADVLRRNLLFSLVGAYTQENGMLLSTLAIARLDDMRFAIANAESPLLPEGAFEDLLTELRAPAELCDRLEERLGVKRVNDRRVVWQGSLANKAMSVLAAFDRPMTMFEIHTQVGFQVNPRSLAAQMGDDPRIMRMGKEQYGLRSSGGEEYSGILEELEQAIERAGGRIDLETTVDTFVHEFGVSPSSVRSYAGDRRFVRNGDGSISMRGEDDGMPAYRFSLPEDTRGLFRLQDAWHLRVDVDHDVLRGSGRPLTTGAAVAAGLEPDLTLGFDYGAGSITFDWSRGQPTIGSIRPTALSYGCTEGDLLFLPLDGPEPRTCLVRRGAELEKRSGLKRLALEMGLTVEDGDRENPLPLARALGLADGADWRDIVGRLHDRGDVRLAEVVPEDLR